MSAMCLRAVPEQRSPAPSPHSVILELEKTVQARVEALAAEIFARAGCPSGKESQARLAAERQLLLSRVRLIECPDSVTLFAFVPQSPAKRISIFLTSQGVAIRSRTQEKAAAMETEQFVVGRWATEIDPHTAYGTLDGNTLCLTGWHLDSPKLKSRFKLWTVSNSRDANLQNADRPVLLKRTT
jgi:hypothetical protein